MNHSEKNWNIDLTTKCTLACSECARTGLLAKGMSLPKIDVTLNQFKKIADIAENKRIHFSGTWGDPVFNPDFIEILKVCKEKNIHATVSNAASHQPESWYEEAFLANTDAVWWFGIDGLPHQSHIYRKNQDGEKLFNIMLKGRDMGLPVVWQYIIFNYNKDNVKIAKKIAKKNKLSIMLIDTRRNRTMFHV
jgi:MoaA/NifB/PqqE/SkfB family radical SAM enzyme